MALEQIKDNKLNKKLTAIEKKYSRKKNFGLAFHIDKIVDSLNRINDLSKKFRDDKEGVTELNKLLKLKEKENILLEEMPASIRHEIDILFLNKSQTNVNALRSLRASPSTASINNSFFSYYKAFSNLFFDVCSQFIKNYSPKAIKGRTYQYSKSKLFIEIMIKIFHQMTGEIPKCENDRTLEKGDEGYDQYRGAFYDFLLELRPLLQDSFDFYLGTDSVIGKNANSLIKKYKLEQ